MRPQALLVLAVLAVFAGSGSTETDVKDKTRVVARRLRRKVLVARAPVRGGRGAHSARDALLPGSTDDEEASVDAAGSQRAPRSAPPSDNAWQQYLLDYAQAKGGRPAFPEWLKEGIREIPVAGGDRKHQPSSVPVLVLPVPIPVPDYSRSECHANREKFDFVQSKHEDSGRRSRPSPRRPFDVYGEDRDYDFDEPPRPYDTSRRPNPFDTRRQPPYFDQPRAQAYDGSRRPALFEESHRSSEQPRHQSDERRRQQEKPRRPYDTPRRPASIKDDGFDEPLVQLPAGRQPLTSQHAYHGRPRQDSPVYPPTMTNANSQILVDLFRAQHPAAPHLPAVLVRDRRYGEADEEPSRPPQPQPPPTPPSPPSPPAAPRSREPSRPHFDRSLMLRGELTVHRADYTESYTAWWDAASGAARVDMNDGATTAYRLAAGAGQLQRVSLSVDRTGEQEVVRCAIMAPSSACATDREPPALPDMGGFTFHGYVQTGEGRVERWRQTVSDAGKGGGARAEALTYHHEVLLSRNHNDTATPLMYSVSVDSSVLGPECDKYVHRYREVREQQLDPAFLHLDIERTCGSVEQTQDLSRVEPLREFTMLRRDPQHDLRFEQFTREYKRKYADSTEEAVRKNLLMQTSRFVLASSRLGATFSTAVNFLSDRLDAEVATLLGVEFDDEHFPAEPFPHSRDKLRALSDQLPEQFDWRERGGVSSVRYQGSCSSCWAFAVAGAVEGALFRRTRHLVPLSEQCLVDCAQPYGGRGCGGTWPSHAYDYVQDRGLPALAEYPTYQARVLACQDRRASPVTLISAHVNVTQHSVPALKLAIRRHAPTVVIIDALLKSFQTYKSGVFYDDRCSKVKKKLKHAVLAVGWGSQRAEPHFILKNSWSAAWGDDGYIRMHGPSNTCGVLTLPSYPRLEDADVLRPPAGAGAPAADAGPARSAAGGDYD